MSDNCILCQRCFEVEADLMVNNDYICFNCNSESDDPDPLTILQERVDQMEITISKLEKQLIINWWINN